MSIATIATKLNIPINVVRKESMQDFLERKLLAIETELFSMANKYGVKSISQLDEQIKKGKLHETPETREDFFEFDNLEAKRNAINNLLFSL